MAITDINISEQLQTDAPSIKYTGNEGPQNPQQQQQEMQIAQQIWEALGLEQQGQFQSFEQFFQSGIWKQILQQMQADQGQAQGIAGLGPRTEEIEEVGVESLRDGGRIGFKYGSPHSSPATEAYSSMGGTDESALMKEVQFLMSEFGLSREDAIRKVTSQFRKPQSPFVLIDSPSSEDIRPPRSLLGSPPVGSPPEEFEDFREEEIGIESLRGRS